MSRAGTPIVPRASPRRSLGPLLLATCAALFPRGAAAADELYAIIVGNNAVPRGARGLEALAYADDDAAAVHAFISRFARRVTLLSVLDAESQQRFPAAAAAARPPTLAELKQAAKDLSVAVKRARQRGDNVEVLFYFSGHGTRRSDGSALSLLDGGITQRWLHEDLLARLPARYVHLIVDACHADAVVRVRDASAEVVDVSPEQAERWLRQETIRRFPHVGALIATAADQRAHEWDVYRQGVFTHQVLSGLRGAADVNGDRRIEYSELHAFLAAANSGVVDARARLEVLAHPPAINRRAPLIDLRRAKGTAWATATSALGHFYLEDQRGTRLAEVHLERRHRVTLLVPAGGTLYLHSASGQGRLRPELDQSMNLDDTPLRPGGTHTRGALSSALQRGLFATAFGPRYYRGFVDREGELGVPLDAKDEVSVTRTARSAVPAYLAWGTAAALSVGAAVLGGLALDARADWNTTNLQRPAEDARSRYQRCRIGFFIVAGSALAAGLVGALLYPWGDNARAGRQASSLTIEPAADGARASLHLAW